MTKHALEIVKFKLNDGIAAEDFLAEIEKTKPFITRLEGYISRTTAQNDEGLWVDVVKWKDMTSALEASKKFDTAEAVKAFMMMIDVNTISMHHFEVENTM